MKMTQLVGISVLLILLFSGCGTIVTQPIHTPLYPDGDEDVAIILETEATKGIETVRLYETVSSIDAEGNLTPGDEVLIQTWEEAKTPTYSKYYYIKPSGFGDDKIVTYRFTVTAANNRTRSHDVSFATRPYPVPDHPAPVYAQGHPDDVVDLVFIPDLEIIDMDGFRDRCQDLIINSIHREPTMNLFNQQFNFYINPIAGDAVPYNTGGHKFPSNSDFIAFAESKVILHITPFQDFAYGSYFSTEWNRPATFMHENGHSMFDLADEYDDGVHWQNEVLPNNWTTLEQAQADAPKSNKTKEDAVEIGETDWYRLCDDECPMRTGTGDGTLPPYDDPCSARVAYVILDIFSKSDEEQD
jgi:uncharacterized protein YceK